MGTKYDFDRPEMENMVDAIDRLSSAIRYAAEVIGHGGETPGALEFIGMQLRDGIKVEAALSIEDTISVDATAEVKTVE